MPNNRGRRRRRDGRSGWPKADGRRRGRGWRRRRRRPGRQNGHWKRHSYRLKPLRWRYRRSRSFRRGKKGGLNIVCNVRYHGNGEKPQGISGYMNPEPGQIQSRVRLLPRLRRLVVPPDGQAERIAPGGIVIPLRQPHLQGSIFRRRALPGHPVGGMQRDVKRPNWRGTAGTSRNSSAGCATAILPGNSTTTEPSGDATDAPGSRGPSDSPGPGKKGESSDTGNQGSGAGRSVRVSDASRPPPPNKNTPPATPKASKAIPAHRNTNNNPFPRRRLLRARYIAMGQQN